MAPRFIVQLALVAIAMVAPYWCVLYFKWPVFSDPIMYALSLKEFSGQFWAGDIYPRWLMNVDSGFGSSVFLFYGPLAYYIMSTFEWLSSYDPHGFGRLGIGLALEHF